MLKPLGSALGSFQPGEGSQSHATDPVVLLGAAWADIVGEEVARNSHPAQVVADALVVTTRSSAWSQQLSFLSEQIVASVRLRLPRAAIEKLRFRVGRLPQRGTGGAIAAGAPARKRKTYRAPAESLDGALAQFREGVEGAKRAKRASGWKECFGCNALIAPVTGMLCPSCANAQRDERDRSVARLLFEAPWLGFAGTAALVEHLSPNEYEAIRKRVLSRWWEILLRAVAGKRLSRDGHERLIASSYVILKSRLTPERIVPATVRNLLGDEIHDLIYETEQSSKTNGH